ncbi:hypothetical protein ACSBR1_025823 [Camellia fascicularis]
MADSLKQLYSTASRLVHSKTSTSKGLKPSRKIHITTSPLSSLFPTHVEMLDHHFQAYYDTLDLADSDNIVQILFLD